VADKIIVAAGGSGKRWVESIGCAHLPADKCRIRINGESLMDRSAEMLRALLPEASVTVVTHETGYGLPYETVAPVPETGLDIDKFLSYSNVWSQNGRTVIVFGDVFLTEASAAALADARSGLRWVGRQAASSCTGKRYGEIFGLSFGCQDIPAFRAGCYEVVRQFKTGRRVRTIGWDVFEVMSGKRAGEPHDSFVSIDDWTEDFDTLLDYERWVANANKRGMLRRWSK
jgi:hypothetical protein